MKRLSIVFIALISLSIFIGCKSEQKKPKADDAMLQPKMKVSAYDTTAVKSLAQQFFARLQQKDLDGAMSMLYYLDDREIKELPEDLAKKERIVLGTFLGMRYDIDHIIFLKETDSELKYTVTMFEKEDESDRRPNKASFLIRPVRRDGKWYLTLADTQTETVKSEIKH